MLSSETTLAPSDLKLGQILQLNPEKVKNRAFAGCLLIVTEQKTFGAQGYVQGLGGARDAPGGQAYYRANWDEIEPTGGFAEWMSA